MPFSTSLLLFLSVFHFFVADIVNYNDIMFPTDSTGSTYFPPVFRPTGIITHIYFHFNTFYLNTIHSITYQLIFSFILPSSAAF